MIMTMHDSDLLILEYFKTQTILSQHRANDNVVFAVCCCVMLKMYTAALLLTEGPFSLLTQIICLH